MYTVGLDADAFVSKLDINLIVLIKLKAGNNIIDLNSLFLVYFIWIILYLY